MQHKYMWNQLLKPVHEVTFSLDTGKKKNKYRHAVVYR